MKKRGLPCGKCQKWVGCGHSSVSLTVMFHTRRMKCPAAAHEAGKASLGLLHGGDDTALGGNKGLLGLRKHTVGEEFRSGEGVQSHLKAAVAGCIGAVLVDGQAAGGDIGLPPFGEIRNSEFVIRNSQTVKGLVILPNALPV